MTGGAQVRAIRHHLVDEGLEDVIVSVTCNEELAHMRDEYDRLAATRPAARFRVFRHHRSSFRRHQQRRHPPRKIASSRASASATEDPARKERVGAAAPAPRLPSTATAKFE
ncbi:hypothetical protein BAE44_0005976 [Dichanthelium oligosanthes]|uniref:Uncharacterized protein n=1 Tax=Dichanthelium oligosanthes TaxID=888268 RepID=A0A1E5W6N8_9POAL|nr:hypothetical protein BAE44_0005976 [Dichanthelium oligosanthes]